MSNQHPLVEKFFVFEITSGIWCLQLTSRSYRKSRFVQTKAWDQLPDTRPDCEYVQDSSRFFSYVRFFTNDGDRVRAFAQRCSKSLGLPLEQRRSNDQDFPQWQHDVEYGGWDYDAPLLDRPTSKITEPTTGALRPVSTRGKRVSGLAQQIKDSN